MDGIRGIDKGRRPNWSEQLHVTKGTGSERASPSRWSPRGALHIVRKGRDHGHYGARRIETRRALMAQNSLLTRTAESSTVPPEVVAQKTSMMGSGEGKTAPAPAGLRSGPEKPAAPDG